MHPADSSILLEFGSRSGSFFALILFGTAFAALGWAVAREIRNVRLALLVGLAVFAFPLTLLYISSLSGFYEIRAQENRAQLHFLLSPFVTTIERGNIREINAVPAFKVSWRLEITTTDDRRYESATSNRVEAKQSAEKLRLWLASGE